MARYIVERVDISTAMVEADSAEEALKIANDCPELWDCEVGKPVAILEG